MEGQWNVSGRSVNAQVSVCSVSFHHPVFLVLLLRGMYLAVEEELERMLRDAAACAGGRQAGSVQGALEYDPAACRCTSINKHTKSGALQNAQNIQHR